MRRTLRDLADARKELFEIQQEFIRLQKRIDAVQVTLKAAGIDPTDADALHQQRMAGMDFKKLLVRATAPDGSVDVDKLLNGSKLLRFTKYGDRLTQFFGSEDAADAYMTQLQKA